MEWHSGRAWEGHAIEDACPCNQEPCGLVDTSRAALECDQHPIIRGKTIRQSHRASDCPALRSVMASAIGSAAADYFSTLDQIATQHHLDSQQMAKHLDGYGSDEAYEEWMQETWEPTNA